jgi:thioredoxin reductase (NADPH)
MPETIDAAVIGAGPCGVAAAVQLRRSGFRPLLFEARRVGGLLRNANLVENYPGFPEGITGEALCSLLEQHLNLAGVDLIRDAVADAVPVNEGYALKTRSSRTLTARTLIIATGTRPLTGLLKEPAALVGRRIFYEAADVEVDGEVMHVLIVGGGDAAFDYALNLARRGATVSIARRSEPRCLPLLRERVAANSSIDVLAGAAVLSIEETENGLSVRVADPRGVREIATDALLVACGREPENTLLRRLARSGKIANHLSPDLYAGGDVTRGLFRQAGIAVGDGLMAAMAAAKFLRGECPQP